VAENQTEKTPKPEINEIAGVENDIFRTWLGKTLQNPDYILQKESAGKAHQLYDEMEDKDPHLFSCVQTRKLGVISKPWEILPGSDEPRDQEICEFVQSVIWNIPYFDRDLKESLDAIPKGVSFSEIMWGVRDGMIVIEELKSRDPRRFVFDTDNRPRLKTRAAMLDGIEVPPFKFLVHTFAPKYENPYGEPVLKKCYWFHWFKKNGVKFWAMFAEKFGTPPTVGKYPPGTSKEDQDKLLGIIEKIQTETGIVIPENMLVEMLEQQRKSSTDTYQAFANYMDAQISKAILGQTLTASEGQHGTQALGRVHQGVRQDYIEADAKSLMPVLNQLITWLVDFNYTGVLYYPEFKIHFEEPGDLEGLAKRDRILFKELTVPVAEDYFYDTYGIPRPTDEQTLLEIKTSGPAMPPAFSADRKAHFADAQDRYLKDTEQLNAAAQKRAGDIYENLTDAAMKPVAKKKDDAQVTADMLNLIAEIELDPKPLAELLRDTLLVADLMAWVHFYAEHEDVVEEINKMSAQRGQLENFRIGQIRNIGAAPFAEITWGPMPAKKAIEFFKKLIPVTAAEITELDEKLERYGFRIAEIENARILALAKAGIEDALESGITVGEFRKRVNAVFDSEGISRLSKHHIENVFTTNLHTAYSAGNWEVMHDPDVADYFPYYQYLTAGDESVRPSHKAMHRFIAHRDDPVWDTWWTPNGYRCRCRVRAISKYEAAKKKVAPSEYPGFEPDDGFEGTPMEQLGLAA